MELSQEQLQVIQTNKSKVVVVAAPGAGKSLCLIERIKYLLSSGVNPSKIIAITFTNAAAEELYMRLDNRQDIFIGTIHKYCCNLLAKDGVNITEDLKNDNFDRIFKKVKQYQVPIPEIEHVLYDEAQDSNKEQIEFVLETLHPKNWMIFCDLRQAIYEWNGAEPQIIVDLLHRNDVTKYELNNNYRCGAKIISFARSLIRTLGEDYRDHSICASGITGKVEFLDNNTNKVVQYVLDDIENGGKYGDWFVLSRTNRNLDYFCSYFKKHNIPYSTFKKSELSFEQIMEEMNKDTIKVLTVHGAKGLEAKKVAVIGVSNYSAEEKRIQYVAATRAKELLVWANISKSRNKYGNKNKIRMEEW